MGNGCPDITLILGGQRSGKSALAERMVIDTFGCGIYVATAESPEVHDDEEMAARVKAHRDRRGPEWSTIEAPLDLLPSILSASETGPAILVDCLTLWISNLMAAERDVPHEVEALAAGLKKVSAPVIVVSNEVGLGVIPMNAMAREFVDHAGRANQRLAQTANRVLFTAAGLPLTLKDEA